MQREPTLATRNPSASRLDFIRSCVSGRCCKQGAAQAQAGRQAAAVSAEWTRRRRSARRRHMRQPDEPSGLGAALCRPRTAPMAPAATHRGLFVDLLDQGAALKLANVDRQQAVRLVLEPQQHNMAMLLGGPHLARRERMGAAC